MEFGNTSSELQKDQRNQQNIKEKKKVIMARTQEPTVDDCERINVIESTTVDSTSHDNPTLRIQIPKLEGELDTEYPKVIGEWWTMGNFVRLNCWISFWISTYIFLDSFRVSGIRLYPNPTNKSAQETFTKIYDVPGPEEYGNPSFPIMISIIFFLAMLLNGVILVTDSKLNLEQSVESVKNSRRKTLKKMFKSVMAISVWVLSEIFLVIVALIYFDYLYGPLSASYYCLVFVRLFIVIVAIVRLWQVLKYQTFIMNSLK